MFSTFLAKAMASAALKLEPELELELLLLLLLLFELELEVISLITLPMRLSLDELLVFLFLSSKYLKGRATGSTQQKQGMAVLSSDVGSA
jgi:hypothetical protein